MTPMNLALSFTDRHGNPWVRHDDDTYHSPECGPRCPDGIDLNDDLMVSWLAPVSDVVYAEVAA